MAVQTARINRPAISAFASVALWTLVFPAVALADPLGVDGGAIFMMAPAAQYQEGCFPPCMCPIMVEQPVTGTVKLVYKGLDGTGVNSYAVEDVNWTVPFFDPPLRITGSGKYSIGSPSPITLMQQRMELNLKVGDNDVAHFDSGWVPLGDMSRLSITVSMHNQFCFDHVVTIDAVRVPDSRITPYTLAPGATYEYGCCPRFSPCDCLCFGPVPMVGDFALVPLSDNSLFRDFAVVNLKWVVLSATSNEIIPIHGVGTFRVGGEVAVQHQLSLDLFVGTDPITHFDSGWIGGGGDFPVIDISLSRTAMDPTACTDTILHVVANPVVGNAICGGIGGLPCPDGFFCKLAVGECCCDFMGFCAPSPGACPAVWIPVCGCDGRTYGNECEADRAGVSIAHPGECGPELCAASRILSDPQLSYCPGVPKKIRIALTPPNSAQALGVEDSPPPGWIVTNNISNGGAYDPINKKVKWGPLFPPFPPELFYEVIPTATSAIPSACFGGAISVDGDSHPICGDQCIAPSCCPLMEADTPQAMCNACPVGDCGSCGTGSCEDGQVTLCEVIGYACSWMRGCNDDLSGMTRAAFVWRSGECYCWDDGQHAWLPTPCPGPDSGCCPSNTSGSIGGSAAVDVSVSVIEVPSTLTAIRDKAVHAWNVPITIEAPSGTAVAALEVQVPAGWVVTTISDDGAWDAAHRKIKWGPFFDDLSRTVMFQIRPALDLEGGKTWVLRGGPRSIGLSGTVSFDGVNYPIAVR
jgi:hypothetical protein